ncbi:MAG: type II toxin-antitoxin system PemK/MazF family toxin [Burkholderiales bacterium]
MRFDFGDIVLVPFPFTDQTAHKQRPAVVVSNGAYHRVRPDLIVMAVTSQLPAVASRGDLIVADWKTAGLLKPSAIKPIIATLEADLVIKALGRLQANDLAALRKTLSTFLG